MSIRKTLNICNCINVIFSIINAEYSNLNTIKSIEYRVCNTQCAIKCFRNIRRNIRNKS